MVDGKQYIAMPVGNTGLQGNTALSTAPELAAVRGAPRRCCGCGSCPEPAEGKADVHVVGPAGTAVAGRVKDVCGQRGSAAGGRRRRTIRGRSPWRMCTAITSRVSSPDGKTATRPRCSNSFQSSTRSCEGWRGDRWRGSGQATRFSRQRSSTKHTCGWSISDAHHASGHGPWSELFPPESRDRRAASAHQLRPEERLGGSKLRHLARRQADRVRSTPKSRRHRADESGPLDLSAPTLTDIDRPHAAAVRRDDRCLTRELQCVSWQRAERDWCCVWCCCSRLAAGRSGISCHTPTRQPSRLMAGTRRSSAAAR